MHKVKCEMHDIIINGLPSQNLGQTQARGALKFG
jgi:hypothetical protein